MSTHDHERALELIMRRGTEEVDAVDMNWLEDHLGVCPQCEEYAEAFASAARLMQAHTVMASAALVSRTQERVHARAAQLQEHRARVVLIAISFCFGALSSAVSAWLWWRFGAWVAERIGMSRAIVEPGIMLFLLLPGLIIAGLMLALPDHTLQERWTAALAQERKGGIQ